MNGVFRNHRLSPSVASAPTDEGSNLHVNVRKTTSSTSTSFRKRLLKPTYEQACKICGIRRFGDKIVYGIFRAERSVELARDGGKRPVRRFVRCTAAHVQLWCTETRRPQCGWIGCYRRGLGVFDLELTGCPMIYLRVSAPQKKEMGAGNAEHGETRVGWEQLLTHQECSGSYLKTSRTVRTTSESLRSTRKVSSAQRWKTPCVPVVPIPSTMSAVMRNGTHSGIGSSFPLINNQCKITAVKGRGEMLPARMRCRGQCVRLRPCYYPGEYSMCAGRPNQGCVQR